MVNIQWFIFRLNTLSDKLRSTLSIWERQAYSNAVLCLMKLPAQTNQSIIAGAKTRYDDFVWVHINQTLSIHGTGNFLSWHRYYTWAFEQTLRYECDYKGYQPYWNWGKSAEDPANSPYFDALPTNINNIPAGQGGGCVKNGPFKDMSVNLGPVSPTLQEPDQIKNNATTNPGSAYNPRCLKRDISSWVSSRWSADQQSVALITNSSDIATFQSTMQGDFSTGFYGVHTAGHFTYGGDPAGDLFTSPGDPAFWLHHGQIDRTLWIWQNQDLEKRGNALAGTVTLNNNPPSRNATLGDSI
ncbi:Di-copper centre-containing protein [Hyaloscypha variabilis]